jgi:diguanylate cyclase (GGDEF)-like protein
MLNDTHGHAAGDRAIRGAATAWRSMTRRGDLVARLGGDEFGLLMANCNAEQASGIAERYRAALAGMPVSVGVASLREGEAGFSLWSRADLALYEAKRNGGDQVKTIA